MENRQNWWVCSCGERVMVKPARPGIGGALCPRCGSLVEPPSEDQPTDSSSTDETMMLDIGEMARIAQNGVDPAISGEWVTPPKNKPKR